jgi:competence protein ComEA
VRVLASQTATAAGGPTPRADLSALNLAAPLVDGIQVLVPARVPVARGSPGGGDSVPESSGAGSGSDLGFGSGPGSETVGPAGRKVSLASATAEELDALPGVGPVTAQKILEYRSEHGPFRSVDDLDAVPGIGPTRIEQLRDLVTP